MRVSTQQAPCNALRRAIAPTTRSPKRVVMLGPSLEQQGGMASVENLIMEQCYDGVSVRHISEHDEGSALHRIKVYFRALLQFAGLLLAQKVDVVHIHLSERGSAWRTALLILLAVLFQKPVITHAHGCEFHLFYDNLPRLAQRVLSLVFRQCAYFIVLSESWRDYYVKRCGLSASRVVVMLNPVQLPETVPNRTKGDRVRLVFLGRIGERKGAFDLLEAFARMPEEVRDRTSLTLAGDGAVAEARQLAQRLGIGEQVTFPGWINRAQRDQLLAHAHVFVLPSYNEGLPMAILEAMSWALPVVTTPVGGIGEIITSNDTGILIQPGDVTQLSDRLQQLIENPSLRQQMGDRARQRVAPLSTQNYRTQLQTLYTTAR
ncbi:glycosyltransferase family 4 protein [Geitlerinema sp. PCC 7407]|uniref:glycosyltransferase family 4 protein n=1 Tax=Geitlerinema sp. PCC 7407 TaxID=1173025 RepID=UPI00029FFD8A|nr:glycosyltransferase family 4 protein [Geitlerinema sp. PCC 7407]AFY64638.1 glycosyl transferase group 1 [Geitlerinema sp. PCC 7407]